MAEQKIIECPDCECKVAANVIAKKEYGLGPSEEDTPTCIFFLECSLCHRTMLGYSYLEQVDYDEWGNSRDTTLISLGNSRDTTLISLEKCSVMT